MKKKQESCQIVILPAKHEEIN